MVGFLNRGEASKRATRMCRRHMNMHPKTHELALLIKGWHWPKGAGKTAQQAIDTSLVAYEAWRGKLANVGLKDSSIDNLKRLMRFRDYILRVLPQPTAMVINHFTLLFRDVARRQGFRGDLRPYAWRADCPEWMQIGYEWASEWCGDVTLWDQLIEAVKNAE